MGLGGRTERMERIDSIIGFLLISLTFVAVFTCADPQSYKNQCGNRYTEEKIETIPGEFETRRPFVPAYDCPLKNGPKSHTECCEPASFECCRQRRFWDLDWRVALSVVLLILVAVCALAAACMGCCFCHHKCPLYGRSLCMKQAKPDYIAQPYDSASYMPSETEPGMRVYQFNTNSSTSKTDLV